MKVYPNDLISYKEFTKYTQRIAICCLICQEQWPEYFKPMQDPTDQESMEEASRGEFPDNTEEEWNDKSQWEAEEMGIPEALLTILKLAKPPVKIVINTIYHALKSYQKLGITPKHE